MCATDDVTELMSKKSVYFKGACGLLFLLLALTSAKKCDPSNIVEKPCPLDQVCDEETNSCKCLPGFYVKLKNSKDLECMPIDYQSTTSGTSSLVNPKQGNNSMADIIIPIILIICVICVIYLNNKYMLVNWMRMKLLQRRRNYDEFMIGNDPEEDDPPLR